VQIHQNSDYYIEISRFIINFIYKTINYELNAYLLTVYLLCWNCSWMAWFKRPWFRAIKNIKISSSQAIFVNAFNKFYHFARAIRDSKVVFFMRKSSFIWLSCPHASSSWVCLHKLRVMSEM
jgi:hypothetical protein